MNQSTGAFPSGYFLEPSMKVGGLAEVVHNNPYKQHQFPVSCRNLTGGSRRRRRKSRKSRKRKSRRRRKSRKSRKSMKSMWGGKRRKSRKSRKRRKRNLHKCKCPKSCNCRQNGICNCKHSKCKYN